MFSPRFFSLSILVAVVALLVPVPAVAQTTTFSISPALHQLELNPGDQTTFDITLTNRSQASQAVRVYVRNFMAKGTEGELTFADDNTMSYAAADWLHLSDSELVLPAEGSQTVTVQVIVPPQAEPGGKYASVMFEQVVPATTAAGRDSRVQVATRMSSLVYITVSGDIIEAGQLLGANGDGSCQALVCGFTAPSFVDKGPVPFQFIFTNNGNVHVRPRGTITITQFGRQVAKITVDDKTVLPNSQRRFAAEWQRSLLVGPYKAELNLVYGTNGYTIQDQASFWAFPWQITLGVVLLTTIIVGLIVSRKHFSLKRLHRSLK